MAVLFVLGLLGGGYIMVSTWEATGYSPKGARLDAVKASPQWGDGKFENPLTRVDGPYSKMLVDWIKGKPNTTPATDVQIPIVPRTMADFETPPASGLRVTWLGHSTTLVEIDGHRFLLDPVWSERPSPMTWAGPRRFHPPPLPLDELPELDGVLISHDHYDHLDLATVKALADKTPWFLVPLGVGAHLEYWGIPSDKIIELDWWQEHQAGDMTLIATPARHFAGRSLLMTGMDRTLWAGFALVGPKHRVYYSGDTGMFPEFAEIGQRLGPFDLTMLDSGAYNSMWADVHLGPEQVIVAQQMVKGKLLLPVHWGTFDLALHAWTEPVERILRAASKAGIRVTVPKPGQSIDPTSPPPLERWWPQLPFEGPDIAPVVSSNLPEELAKQVRDAGDGP